MPAWAARHARQGAYLGDGVALEAGPAQRLAGLRRRRGGGGSSDVGIHARRGSLAGGLARVQGRLGRLGQHAQLLLGLLQLSGELGGLPQHGIAPAGCQERSGGVKGACCCRCADCSVAGGCRRKAAGGNGALRPIGAWIAPPEHRRLTWRKHRPLRTRGSGPR